VGSVLSCAKIADEIEDNIDFLATSMRDVAISRASAVELLKKRPARDGPSGGHDSVTSGASPGCATTRRTSHRKASVAVPKWFQ
jgi:hypothetical protein